MESSDDDCGVPVVPLDNGTTAEPYIDDGIFSNREEAWMASDLEREGSGASMIVFKGIWLEGANCQRA